MLGVASKDNSTMLTAEPLALGGAECETTSLFSQLVSLFSQRLKFPSSSTDRRYRLSDYQ